MNYKYPENIDLQLAAMAASPSVVKPSQNAKTRTLKFLNDLAISSKVSSVMTIRFSLISSSQG